MSSGPSEMPWKSVGGDLLDGVDDSAVGLLGRGHPGLVHWFNETRFDKSTGHVPPAGYKTAHHHDGAALTEDKVAPTSLL